VDFEHLGDFIGSLVPQFRGYEEHPVQELIGAVGALQAKESRHPVDAFSDGTELAVIAVAEPRVGCRSTQN
jgi:hypothetical protein